jgi:hypothetical protein
VVRSTRTARVGKLEGVRRCTVAPTVPSVRVANDAAVLFLTSPTHAARASQRNHSLRCAIRASRTRKTASTRTDATSSAIRLPT